MGKKNNRPRVGVMGCDGSNFTMTCPGLHAPGPGSLSDHQFTPAEPSPSRRAQVKLQLLWNSLPFLL